MCACVPVLPPAFPASLSSSASFRHVLRGGNSGAALLSLPLVRCHTHALTVDLSRYAFPEPSLPMSDPSSAAASTAAAASAGRAATAAAPPGATSASAASASTAASAPLTTAQENRWLVSTFALSLPASSLDSAEFYTQAKAQYTAGRFQLAIRCLEIYISRVAANQAAAVTAAALPTKAAAAGTRATRYGASLSGGGGLVVGAPPLTSPAAAGSKSLPIAPLHLLACAHHRVGDWPRARECFLACTRLGFDPDWQMIVQGELENLATSRANKAMVDAAGAEAVATVAKHMAAHHSKVEEQKTRQAAAAARAAAKVEEEQRHAREAQQQAARVHEFLAEQEAARSELSDSAAARLARIRATTTFSTTTSVAGDDDDRRDDDQRRNDDDRRDDSDSDASSYRRGGGGDQSNRSSLVSDVSYLDNSLFAPAHHHVRSPSQPLPDSDVDAAATTVSLAPTALNVPSAVDGALSAAWTDGPQEAM